MLANIFKLETCFFVYVCTALSTAFSQYTYVVRTMHSFEVTATSILLSHFCDVILLHLLLNLVLMHMFLTHLDIYTAVYIYI